MKTAAAAGSIEVIKEFLRAWRGHSGQGEPVGGTVITEFGDALIKSYGEVERDFAALRSGVSAASLQRLFEIRNPAVRYRYARS